MVLFYLTKLKISGKINKIGSDFLQYLITFLEGLISFISPCMLPMLPVYISYFAGTSGEKKNPLPRAIAFVLGFTAVFSLVGVFAGTLGSFVAEHRTWVNIISGIIIIFFGFNFLGVIKLPSFHGKHAHVKINGVFSAFIFGVVFSISHTPCVFVFLGSAITAAAASGAMLKGFVMLLLYSLGMGIPFILAAVLIDKLTGLFNSIKKNYNVINAICGFFLVAVGVCMMLGWLNGFMEILDSASHTHHSH